MLQIIAFFIGRCAKNLVDKDIAESLEEVTYKLIVLKSNLIEYSFSQFLSIDNFSFVGVLVLRSYVAEFFVKVWLAKFTYPKVEEKCHI